MLTHIIDDIRELIGRTVTFHTLISTSGCSICVLDPVSQTSTDSFCPICSGEYWINTYSGVLKTAHITWGNADLLDWRTGGQLFEGDCRVQIKLEDTTLDMLDNAEYIVVDDKKVEVKSKILRGVPTLNRVILDCIEKEK